MKAQARAVHSIGARKVAEKQSEVPFAVRNFPDLPDDAGLTIPEAACILNIGVSTMWSWIASGKVKQPRRLGRTSRLTAGNIREVIAAGGQ